MILYVKGNCSVKRYRQMLRDLGVQWYCVRGRQFVYAINIKHNLDYEVIIKVVTIEVDDGGAALFKLRWQEQLIESV